MKILSYVCGVRKQDILFDAMEFQQRYHENHFAIGDTCITPFSQPMH